MRPRASRADTLKTALAGTLLACVLTSTQVPAFTFQDFPFDDPGQERAFRDLTAKLRCLVCQNESLAASQSDLAQDLRKEVYAMMRAGKSEGEITAFLVERYGDFVLYEPPLKPATWFLWFGPLVLVTVGGVLLVRTLRRREREPDQALSADERARLGQLLADQPQARGPEQNDR